MRNRWIPFSLALIVLAGAVWAEDSNHGHAWTYAGAEGPQHWGELQPAYSICKLGKEQSPIDIRNVENVKLPAIQFDYKPSPLTILDNGHTIQVDYAPGSFIVVGDKRYELKQFHFHHPSEEAVKGKFTDMDVQLLHRSNDGRLAIVTVRLIEDVSSSNAVLAMLWPHLPRKAGASEKVQEMVNAAGFLPVDRGYWTYMGSLSTPPCTEGVRWFVFVQELSVSRAQLRAFVALFRMNTRGLQDTHGRRIEAND